MYGALESVCVLWCHTNYNYYQWMTTPVIRVNCDGSSTAQVHCSSSSLRPLRHIIVEKSKEFFQVLKIQEIVKFKKFKIMRVPQSIGILLIGIIVGRPLNYYYYYYYYEIWTSWQHYSLNDFKVVNWVTKLLSQHWYSQSGKERENSSVFRRRQITVSDSEDCTDGVKVFHARAAVTQNARSLIVE